MPLPLSLSSIIQYIHNNIDLLLQMSIGSFLFSLLLISFLQLLYYAQGRISESNHPEVAKGFVGSMMIGSNPPRCERRCINCGHCEAVQVPVSPNDRRRTRLATLKSRSVASRSEDASNYKPMSWKCKCGERFLNP